ncbi:hypothetical protein [Paenibacillus alvei]|uniref:hypothetical protein n=1 Tax=Paenibacillus alvei TaxID=44250 RepID=UPI00227DFE53|nr:hypothetical protein [Paenibacillus alvei]
MDIRTVMIRVGGESHQVNLKMISETECELTIRDRARVLLYKPNKYRWSKKGKGAYIYNDVIGEVIKLLEEEERQRADEN